MKIFIICNSKTGFVKRYADWIAEETGARILPYKGFEGITIGRDDLVIFGSRLHAGKIEYLNKIKLQFKNHPKLIVFATGGVPGAMEHAVKKVWEDNFTEEELSRIAHFYMQGGINYEKMGFVDRILMKTAAKVMSRQKDKDNEDAEFSRRIQNSYDISSKTYIAPLVDFIREKYFLENNKQPSV